MLGQSSAPALSSRSATSASLVALWKCRGAGCRHSVVVNAASPVASDVSTQQAKLLSRRKGLAAVEVGKPLREYTYEVGPLGSQEVDIQVTHNGLCHTDVHMKDDDWSISKFPFIPGHEVVGIVKAVGSEVKGLKPGDRIGVGWISDSCRVCRNCLKGDENLCEKGYTGLIVMGGNGGFQDVMRCNADFCYKLPDGLASADAAPLLCAGITVYAPLRRLIKHPGLRVAVLGIGGLGHLALQFAAHMGVEVTAMGSSPSKASEAKALGASQYLTLDQAKAGSKRWDIIINCAPASVPVSEIMTLLANDGSLVQVGIPGGNAQLSIGLQDLVFNQKRLEGSIVGGRRDMVEMLEFAAAKGIKPMLEMMPLSKVNEAMQKVVDNKVRYRVVLTSE